MKIAEEYPVFDAECPPDVQTLGHAYNRLRADALAMEWQRADLHHALHEALPALHAKCSCSPEATDRYNAARSALKGSEVES